MKQYVIGLQHDETYANRNAEDSKNCDIYWLACLKSIVIHVWIKNRGVQQIKNSSTTANNIFITRFFAALLFSLLVWRTPRSWNLSFDDFLVRLLSSESLGTIVLPNPSVNVARQLSSARRRVCPFWASETQYMTILIIAACYNPHNQGNFLFTKNIRLCY